MKARVIATGEIFDIEGVSLRLTGKVLSTLGSDEVEILMPDLTPNYWTHLEHQYAGQFMQAMISSSNYIDVSEEAMADASLRIAHALVEKYKKEEK